MKKSTKNEEIVLDATLEFAVQCATFQARLDNGHRLVAFAAPKKTLQELGLRLGDRVRLACSPYDMSKAIIQTDKILDPIQEDLS